MINIPLGIAALIGTLRYVPDIDAETEVRADWIGSLLFAVVIVLLVLALIEGRVLGWPWWSFATLAASAPVAVAFVIYEHARDVKGLSALMPPALLSNAPYMWRLGLITLFFSGIPGLFLVLAVFLQSGFGLSALESGLVTTPFPVGVMLASLVTERFGNRGLPLRIASGAAMLAVGMTVLLVVINQTGAVLNPYCMLVLQVVIRAAEAELNSFSFALPLLVCGFGMGTSIMALFQLTMSSVQAQDAGAGSGAMQAFQQIGAALGIAISGQLFFGGLDEGMLGVSNDAARFVTAAGHATLWSIAVFAVLALIVGKTALAPDKSL